MLALAGLRQTAAGQYLEGVEADGCEMGEGC